MPIRSRALVVSAVLATSIVVWPSDAEAQRVVRPSTRPWWFAGGLGPSVHVANSGGGGSFTQFMLSQEIGGHFSGNGEGAALGAHIAENFGSNFFRFTIGPRFWYDIQIGNLGVYVAPDAQIGYTLTTNIGSNHWVNMQFGAACRVVLGDRGLVYMRAASFNFNFNDRGMFMTWDLQMGGGVTF